MIPGSATPLLLAGAAAEPAAFQIDRSLRFNSGDSAYLSRTPSSAGNRRTWTWSGWVKRSALSSTGGYMLFQGGNADWSDDSFRFDRDQIGLFFHNGTNAVAGQFKTEARFRDTSAWYHIVVAFDTTNATAADRMRLYVNGDQITDFATNITLPQNFESNRINDAAPHYIGTSRGTGGFFDGYLAEIHFIDGQALAPTDFGEFDDLGVWQAKAYTFESNPNNGTTWSDTSDMSSASLAFDGSIGANGAIFTSSGSTLTTSSITITSSLEIYHNRPQAAGVDVTINGTTYNAPGTGSTGWHTVPITGPITTSGAITITDKGGSASQLYAVRVDGYLLVDARGNNSFHLPFSDNSSNAALGYDAAVEAPTLNPRGGFDVVTYDGNAGTQSITGLAFQPDFIWIKELTDSGGVAHYLGDTVRGINKSLQSNTTQAETTNHPYGYISSVNSDGFTVKAGSNDSFYTNGDPESYVAWCWKAGGTAVSNTDGTITSSVSASTTYGFSVVSYTGNNTSGATVGHGLSSIPKWIVIKSRDQSGQYWHVYHSALDADEYIYLNVTNAKTSGNDFMNGTRPTSSVFSLGNGNACNKSSDDVIAYCWSEVSGFSKFGSYTGNGSSTGPTVTTGFKPRFLLIKNTNNTDGWSMWDSARNPSNPVTLKIEPNSSGAEGSNSVHEINFLDDGFQILGTWNGHNGSGNTMIYAAFADRPGNNWDVNNLIATAGLETANQGFDVVTYTGNGSTQTISGLNFSPDLVWLKNRSSVANHWLVDSVRGVGVGGLSSSLTAAESNPERFSSFNEDGFTVASGAGESNNNNDTYVAWCWKAGGTAVSNTDGTITSQVSANTTYGFSIVSYTGDGSGTDSIGHGLNTAPSLVITKSRGTTGSWRVFADVGGTLKLGNLNNTDAFVNATVSAPTSSVFSVDGNSNASTTHIAYCWSEVPGFSKFNTYSGGTANQTISTGFKPRYLLIKRTDAANSWLIFDSARGVNKLLRAEASDSEFSASGGLDEIEFLNDGFKLVSTNNGINGSGGTYIYAAFAGKPDGSIIDSLIDTPTNYEAASGNNGGNYATLNPLQKAPSYSLPTLGNGNLDATSTGEQMCFSTIRVNSGKWYIEYTISATSSTNDQAVRFADPSNLNNQLARWLASGSTSGLSGNPTFTSYTAGDVLGVAVDMDTLQAAFYKNGAQQGTGFYSLSNYTAGEYYLPGWYSAASGASGSFNFGQRPFAISSVPAGHLALCTTNLPDPTIADGSTAFDTKIYTGNGSSQTISGFSFSPDFAWFKNRATNKDPRITDTIRGTGVELYPSSTSGDYSQPQGVTAFNSDGVSVGSDGGYNGSGQGMVLWAWDGGTSTVSNTDGSITSNVRANASAGFSIVTYTGTGSLATVGHGLGAAPSFIIVKARSTTYNWSCYHISTGKDYVLNLNTTGAGGSGADSWGSAAPTSTVFGVKDAGPENNGSGVTFVAYCFAPVSQFSDFGEYTGNGSSDGPFVFTGFKVAFLLTKRTDTSENWEIRDSTRNPYNRTNLTLFPHSSGAEDTGSVDFDFLSNGFKVRNTNGSTNANGGTYIYAAFAEHPFKTARAR